MGVSIYDSVYKGTVSGSGIKFYNLINVQPADAQIIIHKRRCQV